MTPISQQQLAQKVHAAGVQLVLAVTGGGSGAIAALLSEPGASRSILSATVPYAADALAEWLGSHPDEYCSPRTARAMAMAAYLKAKALAPGSTTCGVATTASLASDRPKRGEHRVHLAWQSAATTAAGHLELRKGRRTRTEEEAIVSALVLNTVAEACGVALRLEVPLFEGERVEHARVDAAADEQDLLAGRTAAIPRGRARADERPRAVFPGAFNPLHAGHRKMARIAGELLGCEVAFEISVDNVDKPPLDFIEIDHRLRQFTEAEAVWLTHAPTFVKKAELFPGATFVVGADTIERVGQERYYGHPAAMLDAIRRLAESGAGFWCSAARSTGRFARSTKCRSASPWPDYAPACRPRDFARIFHRPS